jgi:hypothetical protein
MMRSAIQKNSDGAIVDEQTTSKKCLVSMEMIAALCDLDNPNAQARPAGAKRGVNPYAFFTSKVR